MFTWSEKPIQGDCQQSFSWPDGICLAGRKSRFRCSLRFCLQGLKRKSRWLDKTVLGGRNHASKVVLKIRILGFLYSSIFEAGKAKLTSPCRRALHILIVNVYFVPAQHNLDVSIDAHYVTMPLRIVLVCYSTGHINNDDR